eukprot:CAMPEP_0177629330 /NCGR_PEP_ID=MMETSP0447-20121125/610_1 /TAXON_ID=0 /ORGANISM="Stygamoeba regulata, Strain BSH-02190019" /LENGTH=65 /DNA_ID=CAMNT_0019130643 /DNA_START=29 /DNA_END=226 /DNA_ORIENTATION=-
MSLSRLGDVAYKITAVTLAGVSLVALGQLSYVMVTETGNIVEAHRARRKEMEELQQAQQVEPEDK